jgi:hypothetical protein
LPAKNKTGKGAGLGDNPGSAIIEAGSGCCDPDNIGGYLRHIAAFARHLRENP